VADSWWMVAQVGDNVTRLVELHITRVLESNVWHVRGRDADLVIDTANGVGPLKPAIDELSQDRPVIAVTTHGHFDHVGGLREFEDRRGHAADVEDIRAPFPMRMHVDDFPDGAEDMFDYYGFPVPRMIVGATPSGVSQHLAKLRLAGLVRGRREGTFMYYTAANDHVRALLDEALFHADHTQRGIDSDAPHRHPSTTTRARVTNGRATS